jgi:hypothetical protein
MTRVAGTKNARPAGRKGPLDKKRPSHEVEICLDDDVQRAYDAAKQARDEAATQHDRLVIWGDGKAVAESLEKLLGLEAALDEAAAALEAETWVARMEGMGREAYWTAKALPEHQPTEDQIAEYNKKMEETGEYEGKTEAEKRRLALATNPDTWPRFLVSQCIRPPLSEEELDAIFDPNRPEFSETDVRALWMAAEIACGKSSVLRR